MNVENAHRLEALFALRRAERATALETLEKARDALELLLFALSDEQSRIASLAASLSAVEPDARCSAAALTAALDDRRRKSAELCRAREMERDLSEKAIVLQAKIKVAEDEVARTQKAVSLLKDRLG
jgi:HEAT repeat protein